MDEKAIYELGEQIRAVVEEMSKAVWDKTQDMDLWHQLCHFRFFADNSVDRLVDRLYEEAGIEFCEECGERVDDCTCEDEDTEQADERAAEAVEA